MSNATDWDVLEFARRTIADVCPSYCVEDTLVCHRCATAAEAIVARARKAALMEAAGMARRRLPEWYSLADELEKLANG